jgi:hypothetical protein
VAECPEGRPRRDLLAECVEAYLDLDEEQRQVFEQLLQTEPYRQVLTMNTTTFERGLQQGQRQIIRLCLEAKFGPLSEAVIQRLDALSAEQLLELPRAIQNASSPRELGLED